MRWISSTQYILQPGTLWHPLSSSMLKNKQITSLVNFKTNVCFVSVTIELAARFTTLITGFSQFISKTGGFG